MTFRIAAAAACLALGATSVAAQSTDGSAPVISTQSADPGLVFTLRGGVGTAPEYFGSDEYTAVPDLGFALNHLSLGGRSFGNPDPWAEARGFGVGGSFRYIGERDSGDFDDLDDLDGLDDIDAAVELGVRLRYTGQNYMVFGDIRRGFGGHEGIVGELGADAILRPTDRLRVTFGPRALYGSDEYASTYFGIDNDEAAGSRYAAYDADGGLLSTGLEFGMRYQLSDNWGIEGAVTYDVFRNDAEDSPIVRRGSDDQWGARIGITRTFSIGG
ncbi:MipA/OmpV family protein [Roseivivax sediminis]|uniref:MltA-interacting protein MipA n=1 Tax=Roseivivax sediminis TaxID=936889 RepID=A0A1I2B164_9RHOB|nr:MipA/OmpV family protein [Roseivivax sediminis]SFE49931.1 MltA-interacting protein MipA [Roseivivax sediminis]